MTEPPDVSGIELDPHLNQTEADDEAVLDDIVSGGSGCSSRQTSQQAFPRARMKVLTRPVSSGEDPAAGFSFTKAKPAQQLDFRRPKQTPVVVAAHQGLSPKHHESAIVEDPNYLTSNTTSGPTQLSYSSAHSPPFSNLNGSNVLNITVPKHSKPAMTALTFDRGSENMHDRSDSALRDPLTSVGNAPKITKPRRKRAKTGPATGGPPPRKDAYTNDDLLRLLMNRWRQGEQEHEYVRAAQQQKEVEIQKLREDAQRSLAEKRIEIQQLENTTRLHIEALEQNKGSLMAERERSLRLEDQISRITASHDRLLELLTSHRDTISGKIDDLLRQARSIVPPDKSSELDAHDPIRPMLEQCVEMLQTLHGADTVRPKDLQKLDDTINSFVEGVTRSVEACKDTSIAMEAGQKQLALAVQDQLLTLSGNIVSEHALLEQISDLREVRATVRERLQTTESSLADARREVVALQLEHQEKSRRIVSLETIATRAQSQPTEAPQILLRVQELDSRNKDLQSEIVTLRKEAASVSSQLQQSTTDAREVIERLATTQEQLKNAHDETTRLHEEKVTSEKQAVFQQEQLRKNLSEAANIQLASIQNEHMNAVQQLKLEKSWAEEETKIAVRQADTLKEEIDKLKEGNERSEKATAQLQALLKGARSEKEDVIRAKKAVDQYLKEMTVRMDSINRECEKAIDQVKAKDLEIMALQASQATKSNPSRIMQQISPIRGVQSTRNGLTLHRDSQHASIDQSPSIRSANPKFSRHFTNRPSIVEDSQPTEKPSFVSLEDLMLDDPLAGYGQEGPQTIAGEDVSRLFPSTPGARPRGKDLDDSRNSVFHHTRVVSETQRKQHQSFREATPSMGSQVQSQARTHSKAEDGYVRPRSSVGISPTKAAPHRHNVNIPSSHREASTTRETTNPQGNVKDPRQGKRNIIAAGFSDTSTHTRPSKVQKAGAPKQAKALGPIIEDSQSPLMNGRGRKMIKRKSAILKDDKFTRRFAQT